MCLFLDESTRQKNKTNTFPVAVGAPGETNQNPRAAHSMMEMSNKLCDDCQTISGHLISLHISQWKGFGNEMWQTMGGM